MKKFFLLLLWVSVGACAQTLSPRQITWREDSIRRKVFEMGLPVVEIRTVNREWPHYYSIDAPEGCYGHCITGATKVPGQVTIALGDSILFDSGEYEEDVSGMRVNIRGNYTARMPKKPYEIKLEKKNDMLRRGDERFYDKNWLLITTQDIRADVGSKVAEMLGFAYIPAFEHVNLIFNDEYKGNYLLMEQVRRNTDCRINISKNGYLFEYDPYFWNEDLAVGSIILEWFIQYTFKYPDPDEITAERLEQFTDMIHTVEQSIVDGNYNDYIDIKSFASWLVAHELLGTKDWRGTNHFLTKYDDSDTTKLQMPCLWDFDSAMPDTTEWHANQWFGEHKRFYFKFLLNSTNLDFLKEFVGIYDDIAPTFYDEMDAWLVQLKETELAEKMEQAVAWDSIRWKEHRTPFGESIDYARKWFVWRKAWIEEHMEEYRQRLIPTGIARTRDEELADESVYNLMGQRLQKPRKGINIRHRRKYVFR